MSRRSFMDQKGDDSSNVQVIISSSSSHGISKQTKQEPTSSSSHHYNIGEMNPEQLSSLKQALKDYVLQVPCLWDAVKHLFDRHPELVRIPLTVNEDTVLHFAVSRQRNDFVREFVNYKHVTRQDLEIPNADGNTAFCLAAMKGQSDILEIMIQKNEDLPLIQGKQGMLPVHLAALGGYHETVQHLSVENLLEKMDFKDIERLFFMAFNSNMYDVAYKLLEQYTEQLSIARDDEENLTALHMLARKPLEDNNRDEKDLQWRMLEILWRQVAELEHLTRLMLITYPSILLFDAVKSGNIFFLKTLSNKGGLSELLMIKDHENGQNLLHIAVLFRQKSIMEFLHQSLGILMIRDADIDGNNVLHFAANQLEEASTCLRADIRMRRELAWFKEVEKSVPPELSTMRNKYGKTPMDMFHFHHRKLSDEVNDTNKRVAESGMVVAALVVTVAFAAVLTSPGGKTNAWFVVFIMANAAALFTSSLSIVAFLSIYTSSRFEESEFVISSIHPSLIIGKRLLYISLVTMITAFAAASFLIFGHKYKWVAYVVTLFGFLTIIFVLQLLLSLSSYIKPCLDYIRFGTNQLARRISNYPPVIRMREKFLLLGLMLIRPM